MADIIYKYSAAMVELLPLHKNSSPNFPVDPIAIRQKVAATLVFGYEQCKMIATEPPKGDRLEEAQYDAYVAATSTIFMLVSTLYQLAPWMSGPSEEHRSEAREFGRLVQTDVMHWFAFCPDLARIRKKDIELIKDLSTRMSNSSFAQSRAIRDVMDSWGEPLEYSQ